MSALNRLLLKPPRARFCAVMMMVAMMCARSHFIFILVRALLGDRV